MLARDEFGGQRLLERFVVEFAEYGVNYLAQTLRSELAELSIDGHTPPDVNRRERRVGRLVNCALVVRPFARAFVVFYARVCLRALRRRTSVGVCARARVSRLALCLLL